MDITLHIGAHRCGTTTFQQLVHRNRDRLAARGLAFWGPNQTRGGFFTGLIHNPDAITPQIENRGNRALGLISIERERLARAGHETLLISEENMIGSVMNNLRSGEFYPDLKLRLARFAPGLRPHVRRIGLSLRAYDTFWSSSMAFAIGLGRAMPTPHDLDALTDQPRRWRQVIEEVAEIFPQAELVVWPFERFVSRPEVPLRRLVDGVGPTETLVGLRDWQNASPRLDKLRRLLAMRGEHGERRLLAEGDGRWMPFDVHQQAELRRDYAADLDWLRAGADGLAQVLESPETRDENHATAVWTEAPVGAVPLQGPSGPGWSEAPGFEITGLSAGRTVRQAAAEAGDYGRRDRMV